MIETHVVFAWNRLQLYALVDSLIPEAIELAYRVVL